MIIILVIILYDNFTEFFVPARKQAPAINYAM